MSKPVATAEATTTAETKVETPAAVQTAAETKVVETQVADAPAKDSAEKQDPAKPATAEDKTAPKVEDKKPEAKAPEVKAVPDKYELKLPDNSKLGASDIAKIEALAKERGWSNDRAQEALSERSAWESERDQAHNQTLDNLHEKVWLEQLQADAEVGGQAFEQNSHLAGKALERFLKPDELKALTAMKLNRQPILFKLAARIGKAMESDKAIINQNHGNTSVPKEQQMYPGMFKNKES